MKKSFGIFQNNKLVKLILIMKLSMLLIAVFSLSVHAEGIAQKKLSVKVKDREIEQAILLIEKQSGYRFLYNDNLSAIRKKVTLDIKDASIDDVMETLLQNSGLRYEMQNGELILILEENYGQQQEITIKGKITDEAGTPLANVSVGIKNFKGGTNTDAEGNYTINVPDSKATLIFSYVGYGTQEVVVGTNRTINLSLASITNNLNDVVVVGYGTQRRKDLTGSVYTIKNSDLVRTPTFNPVEAMQGRVPGVDLTRSSGAAGAGVNIRVRGNRTINGTNEPLFIVDGFQINSTNSPTLSSVPSAVSNLNPNDIESIEVLKDASATAIYGSQGANGVFIITTKKGAAGKAKVDYDGYYGINGYTAYPALRTGEDYIKLRREAYRAVGEWNSPADDINLFTATEWDAIQRNEWVDWYDLVARNGQQQSHSISVRGGNDKTKAFLSASYFREEGMLRNNDYNRYTVRMNLEQTLAKWAKVGLNSQLTFIDHNRRNDPMGLVNQTSPIAKAYDDNGSINLFPVYGDQSIISPLADERGDTVYKNHQFTTNALVNGFVELKPIKNLTFRSTFGANLNFSRFGLYESATSVAQRLTRQSTTQQTAGWGYNLNLDNILTYNNSFGDHNLTVTGIQSYIQTNTEGLSAIGYNQLLASQLFYNMGATNPATRTLSSQYVLSNNLAFAGRINYNYKSKYLLALTYRADGASRLTRKWQNFPSVAVAWNISDENFMQNTRFISNLKLRASHGITGNYGINEYGTQSTLLTFSNMGFGENQAQYYYYNQYVGNKSLVWERTASTNIGIDFGLLNNRITGSVEYYNAKTTGLLYLRELPRSSGSVNNGTMLAIYENIGESLNRGVELALNASVVKTKNFDWNSTLTFTKNKEKILKLVTDQDIIRGSNPETGSLLIGRPISSFYSYKTIGIWQTDEADKAAQLLFGTTPFKPGDLKIEDVNGDGLINDADRQYLGSTVPKFVLGWQNSFAYKNFDLGIYTFWRYGQTIAATFLTRFNPSGNGNGPAQFDYWTPENPTNDFPRPRKGGQWINYNAYQGFHFVDGSFLKIKTVTLGYTLPKNLLNKIKAEKLRIYVTANNCFTFSKNHLLRNYDPERGGEEGNPLSRQIVAGVNIGF